MGDGFGQGEAKSKYKAGAAKYDSTDKSKFPGFMGMGGPCNAKSGITNTAIPEVALLASRARPWLPEGISSPPEGN